ncbi:MAG: sigma-70 family RNA polymerase sigma factor [Planctomycetes bacterium]|nr:sigma-70 family RNA polymerase sigma factor [Planctomycetota bacterium]
MKPLRPDPDGDGDEPLQPSTRERLDGAVEGLYDSLRSVARRAVQVRAGQRILDPTDLVHECYLKLAKQKSLGRLSRAEFLALAAAAIRTVLVDHARELAALKRGGAMRRVTLDGKSLVERESIDLIGLEEALTRLAVLDPRMARVVELRFFGGLDVREVAEALGIAPRTVDHDWSLARAWLHRELGRGA